MKIVPKDWTIGLIRKPQGFLIQSNAFTIFLWENRLEENCMTKNDKYCENCGCRMYGGICSNCQEELYIFENQSADIDFPLSDEFMQKVKEQRKSNDK